MRRTGGWAGIIGGVMLIAGVLMAFIQPGQEEKNPQKVLDFYAKNSNTDRVTYGAILAFAACAIVLFFFLALGEYLGNSVAARYVATGGAIFLALVAVGVAGTASAAAVAAFGDKEIKSIDVIYYAQSLGGGAILIASSAFGGLAMVAAGVTGRAGAFRPWLCWTSIIGGVIVAIGSVAFLPMWLLYLWIIIVGIVLVRSGDTVTSSRAGASGPPL
jgi:hypothetical protein